MTFKILGYVREKKIPLTYCHLTLKLNNFEKHHGLHSKNIVFNFKFFLAYKI